MGVLMGKNLYPMGKWVWVWLGTIHTRLPVGKINPKIYVYKYIILLIQPTYATSNHVYIYLEANTNPSFLFP